MLGTMSRAAAFPVVETERLTLRAITDDDAAQLFAIHSDPRWMAWWGADPPTDVAQTRSLIETWAEWRRMPNPGVRWGLQKKADGQLIGSCGLFKWNRQWDSCSTSYELASWSADNGYMTEAMTAVLEWGWEHMSLHRIEALVHPSNTSSRDLLGRLGFEREGHLRQAARWSGRYHDLLLMARLREPALRS